MTALELPAFHLPRVALAPLVAFLTWTAFPGSETTAPARVEVGRVAAADVIAPMRFLVLKDEAERAREAEALAVTVKPIVRYRPAERAAGSRAVVQFFAALDSARASGAAPEEAARAWGVTLTAAEA
ncbi:MAG: hypothetical protein HYR48_01210, partial [Gemmatimonadetes bacterium]|nr:hypothetical protein [Gemmatimonadota bacterium]